MRPGLLLIGAAHVHVADHLASVAAAGWRVAAVHDRDPARARAVADRVGAPAPARIEAAGAPRAALICSETAHHARDVCAALDLGLPVLCEKPLAVAPAPGGPLSVAYYLRLCPPLERLAREVGSGAYGGTPVVDAVFVHDGATRGWLDAGGWMTDPALAIHGAFGDLGSHLVDWALRALGEPVGVEAVRDVGRPGRLGQGGRGRIAFAGGGEATIEAGWTAPAARLALSVRGEGWARLEDGEIEARPGRGAAWRARLDALDAGRSSAEFLAAVAAERCPRLATAAEAGRVDAVLDAMTGRSRAPV